MTGVSPPSGTKAWTSSRSKRRASSRADQRARLKTAWNRLKWRSCSCPVARSAAATVRRPRARTVPVKRTWTSSHVGRVKAERKWDRTDRMGLERNISGDSVWGWGPCLLHPTSRGTGMFLSPVDANSAKMRKVQIIAVKEAAELMAMDRVVGGIEVEDDPLGRLAMRLEEE